MILDERVSHILVFFLFFSKIERSGKKLHLVPEILNAFSSLGCCNELGLADSQRKQSQMSYFKSLEKVMIFFGNDSQFFTP